MLTLKVLNSDAQLNTFLTYSSASLISGEDATIVLRIHDVNKDLRYIPTTGATFTIDLLNSDGTTLTKTPTNPFTDDRSIISFDITAAESANLISQNITLSINESGSIKIANLNNGLSKTTLNGSC